LLAAKCATISSMRRTRTRTHSVHTGLRRQQRAARNKNYTGIKEDRNTTQKQSARIGCRRSAFVRPAPHPKKNLGIRGSGPAASIGGIARPVRRLPMPLGAPLT